MVKYISTILIIITSFSWVIAQTVSYEAFAVGFYNVENLFDTEDDTTIWDEEFTPEGANNWTEERYQHKLNRMAEVISAMGTEVTPEGLSILGVAEVENEKVLIDLISQKGLQEKNWGIVHYDSKDFRGIDVALLYRKDHFDVLESKTIHVPMVSKDGSLRFTRDVLYVKGMLNGEEFHFLVNHWPSRRGGEKKTSGMRELAASLNKVVVDSVYAVNPNAKFVIMGDMNDDPTNKSMKKVLNAKKSKDDVAAGGLYNPMFKLFQEGYGSNAYRDAWSLFDQMIVSENTLNKKQDGLFYYKVEIYKKPEMIQTTGHFKNYPFRTYAGGKFAGGYSDHFPVITYFLKEQK